VTEAFAMKDMAAETIPQDALVQAAFGYQELFGLARTAFMT
jgi:hypothetical protein